MIKKTILITVITLVVLFCSCGLDFPGVGFTVTYDSNGATEGFAPVDTNLYKTGDIVIVAGNPGGLKKTDFEFIGWCSAADCSAEPLIEGNEFFMKDSKVTLYVKWGRL